MLTSATPVVTVLMPTFNSARYLAESIESILLQSWTDFRLIVLDGGSTDPTRDIVNAYAARDTRIQLEVFPDTHPCVRVDAILPSIRSRFIAIQHSDDISYQRRFERQLYAFVQDPELGSCNALARQFWHERMQPAKFEGVVIRPKPEHHAVIKANLLFWWVMHCPTPMFDRHKMAEVGFTFTNPYPFGNDYWQTVTYIDKMKYHNIQEELSAYRMHAESDGLRNLKTLRVEERKLKGDILRHFGFDFTERELEIHSRFRVIPDGDVGATTPEEYDEAVVWLQNLREQNDIKGIFDKPIFAALVDGLSQTTLQLKNQA